MQFCDNEQKQDPWNAHSKQIAWFLLDPHSTHIFVESIMLGEDWIMKLYKMKGTSLFSFFPPARNEN